MDILPLLNEIQSIARTGLNYTDNPYDRERYEHLLELASRYCGESIDRPAEYVLDRLRRELGHITPKVGADAAIFDQDGQILLTLRATDDQKWCLPCGFVEPNESPLDAAVRETLEETGLEVRPLRLVDVFTRLPSAENGPHTVVSVVYLCEIVKGEIHLSHEVADVRFWQIEAVKDWHRDHAKFATRAHAMWKDSVRNACE